MKSKRLAGTLWVLAGLVFLFLAFGGTQRNTGYLAIGVAFVVLGAASLRRSSRS